MNLELENAHEDPMATAEWGDTGYESLPDPCIYSRRLNRFIPVRILQSRALEIQRTLADDASEETSARDFDGGAARLIQAAQSRARGAA